MPNKRTESQRRYQALQETFRRNLPACLHEIIQQGENWLCTETPTAADNNFQILVHNLAGTAGSYGFPEITTLCRHIDNAIRNNDCDASISIRRELDKLNALLNTLL